MVVYKEYAQVAVGPLYAPREVPVLDAEVLGEVGLDLAEVEADDGRVLRVAVFEWARSGTARDRGEGEV